MNGNGRSRGYLPLLTELKICSLQVMPDLQLYELCKMINIYLED